MSCQFKITIIQTRPSVDVISVAFDTFTTRINVIIPVAKAIVFIRVVPVNLQMLQFIANLPHQKPVVPLSLIAIPPTKKARRRMAAAAHGAAA